MKSMCASFFYDVIPPVTDSAVIDDYSVRSSPSQSSSGEEETEPSGGEGRDTMPATNQQEEVWVWFCLECFEFEFRALRR